MYCWMSSAHQEITLAQLISKIRTKQLASPKELYT